MTPDPSYIRPTIRRLRHADQSTLVDFFSRTDLQTRRLRFCSQVSDAYVVGYAKGLVAADTVAYGAFISDTLRGISELRILPDSWPRTAEIALLVEPTWQEKGIGDALLDRVLIAAQNRSIQSIFMLCLKENERVQRLAKKHDAVLQFDIGEVEASLTTPRPTPMSLFYEMFVDTTDFLQLMFRYSGKPSQ